MSDRYFDHIATDDHLADWLDDIFEDIDGGVIALDIEEDRERGYRPRVALIQVTVGDSDAILDPLQLGHRALTQAVELLCLKPEAVVVHGAHNDVIGLKREFGVGPRRLVDTQIAARFLGERAFGLAPLLSSRLGIAHDKAARRSDWTLRPLSDEQLRYAREDTEHLLLLWESLRRDLDASSWQDGFEEECAVMNDAMPTTHFYNADGWRELKGLSGLGELGFDRAAALWAWRDEVGSRHDLHPTKVLPPWALLRLAERGPAGLTRDRSIGVDGAILEGERDRLRSLLASPPPAPPAIKAPARRGGAGRTEQDRRLQALSRWREVQCAATGIEPGFLAPRAILTDLARLADVTYTTMASVEDVREWRLRRFASEWLSLLTA